MEISRTPFGEIADEIEQMENAELFDKLRHYFRRFMEQVEFCGIQICRECSCTVKKQATENKR